MSTLYLHIGTPKTGTTAVQHFMFCNRKILSELGCFVPDFGLRYKGIGYRRNAHWLLPFVREEKQYRKCMRVLEENAKKYPAIFMSDEAIWNTCGSRPGYWKKLIEELAEIGIRLKVIAYVRRQDDYLYSYWAEQVRRGNTGAVNYREYKAESPRVFEHLNYYRYFKTIIPVIGQENISIGIYESGRFQNLQDISRDMLSRIDEVQWSEKFQEPESEENASLKDKLAGLQKEKDKYANLVNGQTYLYENGTFTAVDVKPGSPLTVYFDLGSAKLSAREQAHLEYFVENVIDGNTKISVNGYADKQTGSARRNQQLSEQRVQTVVDLLTKAGANASNIETAAHGSEIQLFDTAAKNRVATIEVK